MYNIRLPKWIATLSGSEFKEEGSYQYGRNAYYGITIGKKYLSKMKSLILKFLLEEDHLNQTINITIARTKNFCNINI